MLEQSFEELYMLFRGNYYRRVVEQIGAREGSLSATECFCVEIIYLLQKPTLSEFAQYLGISLPNATYKIAGLAEKGYVQKLPSQTDKREYHLCVTDKYLNYYGLKDRDNARLMRRIRESFSAEEVAQLDETIQKIIHLMQAEEDDHG